LTRRQIGQVRGPHATGGGSARFGGKPDDMSDQI